MKPIRNCCELRPEVLQGDLDDAIFAADFGHVIEGSARNVYLDPKEFFRNTHPATLLKKVVTTIFGRLADPKEAGALIRLSTGYGGGKTHTLIALWHLANNIDELSLGTELLPAAGRPQTVAVAGVDGDKCGTNVCGRHGGIVTRSLWGDLAFQLGGEDGYKVLAAESADDPEIVPDAHLIRMLMQKDKPVLILLDEIIIYMGKLREQGRKALLSFIRSLIAEAGARTQTVLVMTDPGTQAGYRAEAADLTAVLGSMEAADGLDDVLGRKMTDFDPIGEESARVIVKRLFNKIDGAAKEEASAEYYSAYSRVARDYTDALPGGTTTADYAKRIVECYPFHPRLLDTAKDRLSALQDFQKSRGTLRLFARILRDVWESRSDTPLITAGDLDWASGRIQSDLLQRLNRDRFSTAVDADVIRHAGMLDEQSSTDIHRRVASALLLESLPLNANAAMDKRDIALATLRPSDVGYEPGEAMDALYSICWHTYKNETGDKFQFRYEPNANRIIEETVESILVEDARLGVLALVQDYFRGATFSLVSYPSSARAVADTDKLKLALCDSEALAQSVCDYEDDSESEAKRPRRFRNAILGVAPTPSLLNDAVHAVRWVKAAEKVLDDYRSNRELTKQVKDILPTLQKRARISAYRAFNRVVFQGRPSVGLDEKYLVAEDSALERPSGQSNLKLFLDDSNKIYQQTDALDVDLLLDHIINGSTPSLDHAGAYSASAVHERALSHEKVRLMIDGSPIRNSIIRAVESGKLIVRMANGDVFDRNGCVSGSEGSRRRTDGRRLSTLSLSSDVLIAPANAQCVTAWTETAGEKKEKTREEPADYVIETVTATSWQDAIDYAGKRTLLSLKFSSRKPETAKSLINVAQPFGAQSLVLTVSAGGALKDGGTARYMVEGVKHNTNLKPIDTAAMLMRAVGEDGEFEAELALAFGDSGVCDCGSRFERAMENASEDVGLAAEFGKEE